MTTRWTIIPEWQGETVAVLGAAPSMTAELAESVRQYRTIAANRAFVHAPWADMFVALDADPAHWSQVAEYEGIKVCGVECDIDARYAGMLYETVRVGGGSIQIRNNALAAIRIAERMGAARMLLVGIDAAHYEALHNFRGFAAGLEQIINELRSKGIDVKFVEAVKPPRQKKASRREASTE